MRGGRFLIPTQPIVTLGYRSNLWIKLAMKLSSELGRYCDTTPNVLVRTCRTAQHAILALVILPSRGLNDLFFPHTLVHSLCEPSPLLPQISKGDCERSICVSNARGMRGGRFLIPTQPIVTLGYRSNITD